MSTDWSVLNVIAALTGCALLAPGLTVPVAAQAVDPSVAVVCGSNAGEQQTCAADTTRGVTLLRATGVAACELGTSWGFDEERIWVPDGCSAEFSLGKKAAGHMAFGTYASGSGFKVVDTDKRDPNIRVLAYVPDLSQRLLDQTKTDNFGNTNHIEQRQDLQVNEVSIYFQGWLMSQKFRYLLFVSTQNGSQGALTQVLVGGFMTYAFTPDVTFGLGINRLPGVRSTEGSFPYWFGADERLIADEYFRPSHTTGLFARGEIVKKLQYNVMWGDNLSQLGVDSAQLSNDTKTFSGALIWMPTTGEFGTHSNFGDFEGHDKVATRFGFHYTYSDGDRRGQPGTEAFDVRISDGSIVFRPGLFGPGIDITDAVDQHVSFDAGVKYHGVALEGDYYWRRLNNFRGTAISALPFRKLTDTGFQLQVSAMVVPKKAQLDLSGSKLFSNYGNPYDVRAGVNVFPWKNQVVRWNTEFTYLNRSPVGALSLPYAAGGNGPAFSSNLTMNF